MKGPLYVLFLVLAALASPAAQANVYKCTINGETRYQDAPCPGDRDAAPHLEFESGPDPATTPSSPPPSASPEAPTSGSDPRPAPESNRARDRYASDATNVPDNTSGRGVQGASAQGRVATRTRRPETPQSPPPDDDSPLDRAAQLGVEIAAAETELRAVVDERRDTLAAIDVRIAAGGDRVALNAERERRDVSFRERRLEVASRLARLKAELADVCPNGTFQNVHRLACR